MNAPNTYYNELCQIIRSDTLISVMEWMSYHSQSLILNYGEDNEMWEIAWIVDSGRRFVAVHSDPLAALKDVLNQVRTVILETWQE